MSRIIINISLFLISHPFITVGSTNALLTGEFSLPLAIAGFSYLLIKSEENKTSVYDEYIQYDKECLWGQLDFKYSASFSRLHPFLR